MSTGINLGFAGPVLLVDIDNDQWFTDLLGVPDVPDAIDANKLGEARALVLAGLKAAIAGGVDPSTLVVLIPSGSAELASASAALGVLAPPAIVHASGGDMAAACDTAHATGAKFVCMVDNADADTIGELQASGVEADAWFVRGASSQPVVDQARVGGRVNVVVASRGSGAFTDDCYGDALRAWASGDTDAGAAADQIGAAVAAAGTTAAV